ncbi:hypothetical protein HDK64DRAFT_55513 [Phyllosticta capitalensis]
MDGTTLPVRSGRAPPNKVPKIVLTAPTRRRPQQLLFVLVVQCGARDLVFGPLAHVECTGADCLSETQSGVARIGTPAAATKTKRQVSVSRSQLMARSESCLDCACRISFTPVEVGCQLVAFVAVKGGGVHVCTCTRLATAEQRRAAWVVWRPLVQIYFFSLVFCQAMTSHPSTREFFRPSYPANCKAPHVSREAVVASVRHPTILLSDLAVASTFYGWQ